ncbi:unnamed protein product [Lampetra fluviatilis]
MEEAQRVTELQEATPALAREAHTRFLQKERIRGRDTLRLLGSAVGTGTGAGPRWDEGDRHHGADHVKYVSEWEDFPLH